MDLANENLIEEVPEEITTETKVSINNSKEVKSLIENTNEFFKKFSEYSKKKFYVETNMNKAFHRFSTQIGSYVNHIHVEIEALVDGKHNYSRV